MVSQQITSQLLPQLQEAINTAIAELLNEEHQDDMITYAKGVGITAAGDDVVTKKWLKHYENKALGKNTTKPTPISDQKALDSHAESVADGTIGKKYMTPNVMKAFPDKLAKGSHFKNLKEITIKMK